MILSQPQAEAVYSAICALNNVGASICGSINLDSKTIVSVWRDGSYSINFGGEYEAYENQAALASAYGLQ